MSWTNKDKEQKYNRSYYQRNKERIKAQTKAYGQSEAGKATRKRYLSKMKEQESGK